MEGDAFACGVPGGWIDTVWVGPGFGRVAFSFVTMGISRAGQAAIKLVNGMSGLRTMLD